MDAVELNYPVDVPKLMGPDGFGGVAARVSENCEPLLSSSIQRCSTSIRHKDGTTFVSSLESDPWIDVPNAELCSHNSQLPSCRVEDLSERYDSRVPSGDLLTPEVSQIHRKIGKVSRSIGGCSKRQRVAQLDDTMSSAATDDIKHMTTKCCSAEKTQMMKSRNNLSGKRSDKRNVKAPMKNKFDSFSMKAGLANFSAVSGVNNVLGVYGPKSDIHDVTTLVEDLSLNELLDGTYKCPSLGKGKRKKAVDTNENFLLSVRKACSLIPFRKSTPSQSFAEIDSCSNKILSTCPSPANGDKEDSSTADTSSCDKGKEPFGESERPTSILDFQLYKPEEILERLALPPPKDLESLLLDATKPSASSRSTSDLRSGKQISRRPSLPPFPWSHTYTGHCRTGSDSVKFQPSRSACVGGWVKIANDASTSGARSHSFTNLESLAYDQSLVPSESKHVDVENRSISFTGSFCFSELGSSSLGTYSKAFRYLIESGPELKGQGHAGFCPRLFAAAQILHDIANNPARRNPDGIIRWPKKPSQKAMKARKSKLIEKPEKIYATTSASRSEKSDRSNVNEIMSLKKARLSMVENKKDLFHSTSLRKRPVSWSIPRSSKVLPTNSVRDSVSEVRHSTANIVKQNCMMYPPTTDLDKVCSSQHKSRKLPADWSKGRERLD